MTLYPPGHIPYGRAAVAPVDPQGEVVRDPPRDGATEPAWSSTVFAAAVDADAGTLWPKEAPEPAPKGGECTESPSVDARRRRTQGRYLDAAAALLGISPDLDATRRERIARVLAVPCLELHQATREFEMAKGLVEEGRVITRILRRLQPTQSLSDKLLAAGQHAGLWGPPRRWDPGGLDVRRSVPRC